MDRSELPGRHGNHVALSLDRRADGAARLTSGAIECGEAKDGLFLCCVERRAELSRRMMSLAEHLDTISEEPGEICFIHRDLAAIVEARCGRRVEGADLDPHRA
jgi:hypothetical protein